MSGKTPIFIIGATGYIGGTVLSRLLAHHNAHTFDITALVRSPEKAKILKERFGVHSAVGSFEDTALLEQLSANAHVVLSMADSDDVAAMQAILQGLKKRHESTGDVPVLIHTSGTGQLIDGQETKGMAATDLIYDDTNFDQMASIKPTAFHRDVDLLTFAADAEGYCRTYVVLPSTIYGTAHNALVAAGVQNPRSIQIPMLAKASLHRGRAGMVGAGLSRWPNVHIDDVADLYIILLDAIASKGADAVDHGARGCYFAENGEHAAYEISRAIGEAMVALGRASDPEPTPFTDDELKHYFGSVEMGHYWGTNSRCRAAHARTLGWAPRYATRDMIASVSGEVEAIVEARSYETFKAQFSKPILARFNIPGDA
ncbi:NAD(P)-binding protein [Phanerochaete sordida]|uniref:NAD(P)-binding protein n=1 Tax=Phanerochaete sordida TaxID=48140 RepID=A0A9P3GML3_9APHY|nr:NAD(P)-binding protein [Phanerochaete sordida]